MDKETPNPHLSSLLHLQEQPRSTHKLHAQQGNHHQATTPAMLSHSSLLGSKSIRGRQGCHRSISAKSTYRLPFLQNGDGREVAPDYSQRHILHLHRPLRCLPPHSHSPSFSEVPGLYLRRKPVFLPSYAIWNKSGPQDFHIASHGSPEAPSLPSNLSLSLYRRLAHLEQIPPRPPSRHLNSPGAPNLPGLHHKLEEIPAPANSSHHLPRRNLGGRLLLSSPKPRKHQESVVSSPESSSLLNHLQETVPATARLPKLRSSIHPVRIATPSPHNSLSSQVQEEPHSSHIARVPLSPALVEQSNESCYPSSYFGTPAPDHPLDRCLPSRMGRGVILRIDSPRPVDPGRATTSHQCPGMQSSHFNTPSITPSPPLLDFDSDRQHSGGITDKQTGLQQEQGAIRPCLQSPSPLPTECLDTASSPSSRPPQHLGGRSLSRPPSPGGMVPLAKNVPLPASQVPTPNRPVRSPGECTPPLVRVPISLSNSNSGGRPDSGLEQVEHNLPVSPSESRTAVPGEATHLPGERNPCSPAHPGGRLVANPRRTLFYRGQVTRGRSVRPTPVGQGSRRDILALSRVQFLTRLYTRRYSRPVAAALTSALRPSSTSQYETGWKAFQEWLTENPRKRITKASVLLYLTSLATTRQLSPKTILVYRNALKLPLLYGFNINTTDREFSLLARSQFIANPPPRRIIPAWKLNIVLSMLQQPEFLNHRATPHRLLMKTLFLTALTCGNRTSELAAFSRIGAQILPGASKATIAVHPGFLYKNQTLDRAPPNIVIKPLLNPDKTPDRLCPVDALRHWLQLSANWGSDAIFVNPKSKKKMNRGAISHLLVTTINASQPGVFAKAHDVRKVAASRAWARGVPPHDIVETMFWSSSSVFINKYLTQLN